jgi:hypothetical protein
VFGCLGWAGIERCPLFYLRRKQILARRNGQGFVLSAPGLDLDPDLELVSGNLKGLFAVFELEAEGLVHSRPSV